MKKKKIVSKTDIIRQLKGVDALFVSLEKDKTLPTFVEHVALCIILGTSERVNLKNMYPKVHNKLSRFIQLHQSELV